MSTLNPHARANEAETIRIAAAKAEKHIAHQHNNGDETRYRGEYWGNYSKGLKHDFRGDVDPTSYETMLHALSTGVPADFEAITLGGDVPLVDPQAGLAYELEGRDPQSFVLAPAPELASAWRAGEAVEDYWMALLRDVPFSQYGSDPLTLAAIAELNALSDFRGPRQGGQVTGKTLFRGFTAGDLAGPYISQFLLLPFDFGAVHIDQRFQTFLPIGGGGADYLTDFASWLAVQNGQATDPTALRSLPFGGNSFDPQRRYLRDGRGLAAYVHVDVLFEAYFNGCLVAIDLKAPFNPGNPYNSTVKQQGFGTFGTPYAKTQVAAIAAPALKAIWFQKWFVHRVLRPEAYGALVHKALLAAGDPLRFDYPLHGDVLNSDAVGRVQANNGSWLLPQAFPEGSPWHPSYGQGHGTVAGACATMLKAIFDEDYVFSQPMMPSDDGLSLQPYTGPDRLTLGGEANKLAANIALGRNHAGVHWRSDYERSVILGEEIAIRVLRDQKATYNENASWSFTRFDGTKITI
ncbi:vanadium-dependent haloperoxidase [Rhodopila sp.]|uniref:vanadium-dependent haloperoxidase n=1 Tax=Rhodopila sp. TaxID=2480087 RepID=UPI003D0D7AE8